MPTLLDTAEFALAKATLRFVDNARQERLDFMRKYLQAAEIDLECAKQQAAELPNDIARYRAEIARLEATTGADILREAMGQPQPQTVSAQEPRQLYYLQDARQYVGNCVLWWRKDGAGYTTEIDEAAVYEADSIQLRQRRDTDVPWPKEVVDAAVCRHVRAEALRKPEPQSLPPVVFAAQPPGEVVEVQSPKPHACPRCDEGMREIEITNGLTWFGRDAIEAGARLRALSVDSAGFATIDEHGYCTRRYRFTRPDIPPQSEWCNGSGKGGAE